LNRFTLALGIALAVVEVSLAIVLIETSDHEPHVGQTLALAVTAGVAFIVSGLVALWRRPENRTGIYLAAVGYLWFFGALSESNNGWLFAIGFVFGSLPWVPFAALLLTHPTGRFEHRLDRAFPWIVGITAVSLSATIALLAPTVPSCDGCPTNPLAVTDAPGAVRVLDAIDTASGIVLALAAVLLMTRRWRRASRALRRALWPVLATGAGALVTLIVSGVLAAAVSSSAGDALSPVFLVFFAAVPIAFLFGILRTRLARSSVSELVLALQAGAPLRSALGKSLGDSDLDVAYRLEARRGLAGAGWVDLEGRSVPAPVPDAGHSVRLVERDGELIAAIVHDRALDSEPELLDAVTAAAALTLENDRLQAELRAEVSFITTVTNTAPSLLVNIDPDGRIRGMNAAALEASGHSDEEAIRGRTSRPASTRTRSRTREARSGRSTGARRP
jgi:PAS domain-containing protein